jgi:microcystin-dependent protein
MAKSYNNTKTMKSVAIGTIMPWSGDITTIPIGWIKCDGSSVSTQDYPLLYQIVGNRYGGDSISFNTPNLLGKAIVDFHPSHQNISGIGMPDSFKNRIGTDTANTTSGTVSNIDVRFSITNQNNFSASVTGISINPPSYSDTVSVIPRLLGDHHMGTHGHTGGISSVGPASQWAEECEGGEFTNCAFFCPDDCSNISFYAAESNGNASLEGSSFVIPRGVSGNNLGVNLQAQNANQYALGQLAPSNTPVKNFILPGDDCIEQSTFSNASGQYYGYPVALNHPETNFVGRALGHTHDSVDFDITIGSMRAPNTININTISTGSVQPINQANVGVATIRVDNVSTPSLSIIYIIRAY